MEVEGSVEVNNEVDVNITGGEVETQISPASKMASHVFNPDAGESETWDFGQEIVLEFYSPLLGDFTPWLWDGDGELINGVWSFTHPIPMSAAKVLCANESDDCIVYLNVFGK